MLHRGRRNKFKGREDKVSVGHNELKVFTENILVGSRPWSSQERSGNLSPNNWYVKSRKWVS